MTIDHVLREQLTPEQYEAATDSAREVLCLACAGSGKSRTLAFRIARLLAEGVSPNEIVAFTFTEKAAQSTKRRVAEALMKAGIDSTVMGAMYIGTIHAYCQRLLAEIDAVYRQFDVLDENRLKLYLISRYGQLGLRHFRNRATKRRYFETIKQISEAWKIANDELLEYSEVSKYDTELGALLERIRAGLQSDQYIDFSLMIRNVVEAMRTGVRPAPNVRHLMVDEYQDINPCQEELIRLFHQQLSTLFVVGDDDQSIYAWRGADVGNIMSFSDRYPAAKVHTLSTNFRSTGQIVETANAFVSASLGPDRIPKSPVAGNSLEPCDLGVFWFRTRDDEAEWVADRIEKLLGTAYAEDGSLRGLTPADFAILMRSTRGGEQNGEPRHAAFTQALARRGIPFSLEAGGGPFDRPQTAVLRSTFALLRTAPPDRTTVRNHFEREVLPAFPEADFNGLVRVLSDWGRKIHRPAGASRIRLYPQALVYDLLQVFNISAAGFDDGVMRDIGLFSRMILDVETVYMSVDSTDRFSEILNFLENAAETGYDVSTDDVMQRPDAVTISTVHKVKGLEFPCVFVVDVESGGRFPMQNNQYRGWLPRQVLAPALRRGAYQNSPADEARLFYTALTRAERYLYVTGAAELPGARRSRKQSVFALQLQNRGDITRDPMVLPEGLTQAEPRRRIDETDYPTSFTEVRYYLQCPKSYQFRERFGLNPVVPEMFGYGQTIHTSIQKLHDLHPETPPNAEDAENIVRQTFHLKHVSPSGDGDHRPGPYERARAKAIEIVGQYVQSYGEDFKQERQLEVEFEIPAAECVITGSIDLLLKEDQEGNIVQARIVDFKTMEGGDNPEDNDDLDWTELSLQVQLYARAAEQVLGHNARTGSVHLLRDNQRVEVPVGSDAVEAAVANVEWAVQGILASDYPMRPAVAKCGKCDFQKICPATFEEFARKERPPAIHVPNGTTMARAFSEVQE